MSPEPDRRLANWTSLVLGTLIVIAEFAAIGSLHYRAVEASEADAARLEMQAWIGIAAVMLLACVAWGLNFRSFLKGRRKVATLAAETEAIRRSEQRFHSLVDNASDVIAVVSTDSRITYLTPSAESVLGGPSDDFLGRRLLDLVEPEDAPGVAVFLTEVVGADGVVGPLEWRFGDGAGGWRQVESLGTDRLQDDGVGGLVLTMRDVTERKALEALVDRQAFQDLLTGLANRNLFSDRIERELDRLRRTAASVAVLLMDIDDFKGVNDSLGHSTGDELLVAIAERLTHLLRAGDSAARFGGDEFAVLLAEADTVAAQGVAERVMAVLRQPFMIAGRELFVSVSIGIAVNSDETTEADDLLRNADLAMRLAKANGKGSFEHFRTAMRDKVIERLELKGDLHRAVERDQLFLLYQPTVNLQDGSLAGVEALARWRHPTRGIVAPTTFIPLAEETGLIIDIGRWVLERACADAALWASEVTGARAPSVSVNLSSRQLLHPGLVEEVVHALGDSGLDAGQLVLEITESVLLLDSQATLDVLCALKGLGIRLAIDDFGTGYSSLSYLRRLPVDILKVDKSFVDSVGTGREGATLTATIIRMAMDLGLDAVAEGVEEPAQLRELQDMNCSLGQGFLFARPVEVGVVSRLLHAGPFEVVRAREPVGAVR